MSNAVRSRFIESFRSFRDSAWSVVVRSNRRIRQDTSIARRPLKSVLITRNLGLNNRMSLPSQTETALPGQTTQLPELFEGVEHFEPRAPKVSVVSCRDRQPVASRGRGDVAVLDGHTLAGL